MPNTIVYNIKEGDTLTGIAQKLGIKDWHKLRDFHNSNANYKVRERIYAGKTLIVPNKAEVARINGTSKEKEYLLENPEFLNKKPEKKPAKKKEKKEAAKSEHAGKYFVVNNATCVCNKAENPSQTAKLQVTTHKLVVFNNQQGKFAATEEDKQFNPPAATFGKCTLKPSSGGNLPCQVAPAPKWAKSYNKTKVLGKNILTEISTLQCTVGGKISIKNHGQSNTVTKQHADNSNKAQLALVNPAVTTPPNKKEYPTASSITLNQIENRIGFLPITSSKEVSNAILIRQNELCSFTAKLSEGNSALISWVIYDGFSGDVSKKILFSEQVGSKFKNAFPSIGNFRVEGFGKPKTDDFEGGKFNKNFADCSLDVDVIVNKLVGTELNTTGGFKKGIPISFEAPFLIEPNFEELQRLLMYAIDGAGNLILDGGNQTGNKFIFTPKNSGAKYTIQAEYKDNDGKTHVQKVSGETIKAASPVIPSMPSIPPQEPDKPNVPSKPTTVPSIPVEEQNIVLSISHTDEVVRPETPLTFTAKTRNANKLDQIKWNLNGRQIGTGVTINVPTILIATPGKYVIEAYIVSANAYGSGAKKEQDDWHFEVKKNDVVSFSSNNSIKVGKKSTLTADKFIFKNLVSGEQIAWQVQSGGIISNTKSIIIMPEVPGKLNVTCKINNNTGVTFSQEVKQATVTDINFTDASGVKIKKASWGQSINLNISQTDLENENIEVIVSDDKNTVLKTIKVDKFKSEAIPFILDNAIKSKTNESTSLNIKVKSTELDLMGKDQTFPSTYKLEIGDVKEVYNAIFSSDETGKTKISKVNYNNVSFFYGNTRGIKKTEKLFLQLYNIDPNSTEPLLTFSGITVDDSGVIKQKINWGDIKDKLQLQTLYAVVRENDNKGKVLYFSKGDFSKAVLTIIKESDLPTDTNNKTPSRVDPPPVPKDKEGVCECEANVRAFMRMLRIGEGTVGQKGYTMMFGGEHFTDMSSHPRRVIKKGKYASSAAGAYQIMDFTYDWLGGKNKGVYNSKADYIKKYKIPDFTPESQDKLCIIIMKHKRPGLIDLITKNRITEALEKHGSYEWASLPPARYGQSAQTTKGAIQEYKKFLAEEMKGTSDLHLKKGFLKEFGYDCCSGKTEVPASVPPVSDGKWHDPVDNPICTLHTQNGAGGAAGKHWGLFGNTRGGRKHHGLDFFTQVGDNIYACLDSVIEDITYMQGYGNTITLKITQDAKETFKNHKTGYKLLYPGMEMKHGDGFNENGEIYFFYAHIKKIDTTKFIVGKIVKAGTVIGKASVSGVKGGTRAPHLHFEIRNKPFSIVYPTGFKYRCNAGLYVNFKGYDAQSEEQKSQQAKTAKTNYNDVNG